MSLLLMGQDAMLNVPFVNRSIAVLIGCRKHLSVNVPSVMGLM